MKRVLDVNYLYTLLRYEPNTGELWWRLPKRGRRLDRPAGCKRVRDYTVLNIDGVHYQAHRVIWAMVTGAWPSDEVDHRNRKRGDNRWRNLREATSAQNKMNTSLRVDNSTGYAGVSWPSQRRKWRARLHVGKREQHLGLFLTKHAAASAVCAASLAYYGEFARVK